MAGQHGQMNKMSANDVRRPSGSGPRDESCGGVICSQERSSQGLKKQRHSDNMSSESDTTSGN